MAVISFVATECTPYIKTGGLADVIGSLPQALTKIGYQCNVVLPLYKEVANKYMDQMEFVCEYNIDINYHNEPVKVMKIWTNDIAYFFIQHSRYFERDNGLYGYEDDGERFAYFQKAVIELYRHIDWYPNVIHCHDWHTGMIPCMLKENYWYDDRYNNIKTVYTIHNLKFQGNFGKEMLDSCLGLSYALYENGNVKFDDGISFMKTGILYADKVTTVSPSYAQEILTSEYGCRLENVLIMRSPDLWGIVNGIDTAYWDPYSDPRIAATYSQANVLEGKAKNKEALQKQLGLTIDPDVCVFGVVSRLTDQKGIDLILDQMDAIVNMPIQLVILGNGNSYYEQRLSDCENGNKGKIVYYNGYNEDLAHQIYAGCDAFLMPSAFEPCGISQLIAMRYGTLPVVRETGGLKDTVIPYNLFDQSGTGFSFYQYDGHDMTEAMYRLLSLYYDNRDIFNKVILQAMDYDVSWDNSAYHYDELYKMIMY